MDTYTMNTDHYPQRWPPPHLLPQSSFPSAEHYTQYYQQQPDRPRSTTTNALSLNLSSLTVASPTNLSPINPPPQPPSSSSGPVTPISPSSNPFQQQQPHLHHHHHHHIQQSPFQFDPATPTHHYDSNNQSPSPLPPSSSAGYDTRRTPAPSRSSSSSGIPTAPTASSSTSTTQLPRKRSFTTSGPSPTTSTNPSSSSTPSTTSAPSPTSIHHNNNQGLAVNVNLSSSTSSSSATTTPTTLIEEEEPMLYDDEARDAAMELASYDDLDVRTAYGVVIPHRLGHPINFATGGGMGSGNAGNASPVDGSGSTSGAEDSFGPTGSAGILGMGGSMNVLGKPLATNNFVTKLYQMINDPKSTQFIAWTELGTSFVVSNVGEFSRSILGSHFKHNNFSSFVRQLNMYGFHKINRTPRAQRTSTDAQTWEFSHHKFLRARPDLLDEIKRKALEPDPAMKHRVELPGEVASQLNAMRDENRRMWDQLTAERRKVEKLVSVVGRLWDVVSKGFPGSVPQFPAELLETADSPNIYITSPTTSISTSRFPPPLSMNLNIMHSLNSPNSSPTTPDFQSGGATYHHQQQQHGHHTHHQSQLPHHPRNFQTAGGGPSSGYSRAGDSNSSTPLPSSPGSSITMDLFDDGSCDPPPPSGRASTKRQRLDDGSVNGNSGAINVSGGPGGIGGLVGGGAGGGGGGGGGGGNADSMSLLSSVSSPGSNGNNNGLATLTVPKKSSRARSDSAPLGYNGGGGLTMHSWQHQQQHQQQQQQQQQQMGIMGRPRSGSGLVPTRVGGTTGAATAASMGGNGNGRTPLLSITTVESDMGGPR